MKKLLFVIFVFVGILNAKDYNYYTTDVAPVNNDLYKKECASCHFAYQPGLLPSSSWQHIMDNLENHYGSNASLDENDARKILAYLLENSSEKSNYKRSIKITNSLQNGVVYTSLTQIPYLQKKHRKIPKHLIEQKEVGSLARCSACHKQADKGIYNDEDVYIPNYGRMND
ncbi:diheme cytochrome c [Campylobacter sp. CCS1377]|uniref:Diheme cytochrome c n=1 Tax=Campylobacter sp. CCS1377 TaxID=3158229 RepID=A0AAU7E8X4_9BACT|nr:diheme cytochrome c [Campylobacter jejuni]